MRNDILIIGDGLIEPPTDCLAFRAVTMMAHYDLNMDVLLQTTQEMKDLYYHWMKPKGLMDFIEYLLNEKETEDGVRIDVKASYPNTIVVQSIRLENQIFLLGKVKWLANKE